MPVDKVVYSTPRAQRVGSYHNKLMYDFVVPIFFLYIIWKPNWCNGFYIEFRQCFAKETFSYDEYSKS